MRLLIAALCAALLLVPGCHQVTEYQGGDTADLVFIRTDDLQVEKVVEGIPGGRTVLPYGSHEVLVISSEGLLYRIDTETLAVDTSYSIGGNSGTGYEDAAIAASGNLYVLGPGSQVIEVDLATNTVEDNFTPGAHPGALTASPTLGRLYFVDTVEDYIGEIITANNITGFTSSVYYSPLSDLMVEPTGGRFIIAVCADELGSIYSIWLDYSTSARLFMNVNTGSANSAVIPMTSDSVYAICCPRWDGDYGSLVIVKGYMEPSKLSTKILAGHPLAMCFNEDCGSDGYLSVLGRTDSGSSVLSVFSLNPFHDDLQLEGEVELGGTPRDLTSPGSGDYIIVLTSE
ncbi:MAG: hypothetical protein JXA64_05635 [Candidatus Fermentibacteraceae bacterium]|nr:hypothetical protein [Candidatus Fermentibacteraceae bacterium]